MRYTLLFIYLTFSSCNGQNTTPMSHQFTNQLINETSPYLLQHAHNPVNWKPWNEQNLLEAKQANKLIIISVGYAACHWCHVMEHESFEDQEVANVMNANYISIKVDREERPDVDQVYMNAVQLMTGQGGWPLNIVALPDGRPVWGGTYFKKQQWISALKQIANLYRDKPEKLYEYANKLEQGVKALDIVNLNTNTPDFDTVFIDETVKQWSQQFDYRQGGMNYSPKFMMPNNYQFLLRYAYQTNNKNLQDYVNLTLTQMAYGGIYDQIGGGFSRYSTDAKWHIPHFEKMLYDNGQLVSLYADAYLITKNELYKNVVVQTLAFIERELKHTNGIFYSSLDADSNTPSGALEEGAYYVWQKDNLKTLLQDDFELFADYYNINNYGFWEHDNYVLIRNDEDASIVKKHKISLDILNAKKTKWQTILLTERQKRPRPGLDDKTLTSWNAIMLKGYLDAYRVLKDEAYLNTAIENANFISNQQLREDGGLNHNYKNGKSTINGYLEDYANTIDAFIALYQNTLDEKWLITARDLTNYVFDHFFDPNSKMFYFTSNQDAKLISRSIEYKDNVIPASNSIMAKNLFKLSQYFGNPYFYKTATSMLNNVVPELQAYPSGHSNWLDLMLNYTQPYYEIVVVGKDVKSKLSNINANYIPNKLIAGSTTNSELHLLKHRYVAHKTLIYVCINNTCKIPVSKVSEALKLINQ